MASGLSANGVFDVKSDPAGDVVIAERAGFTSASLSVVTGSLAEGTLAPPALLDTAQGGDVSLGMGPDGTAVVVAGTSASREVRVFRRSSTGAFDPAVVAACLPAEGTGNSTVAGVQADGTTTLLVDAGLVRDAPSDAPGAVRTCPTDSDVTSREVHYSAQPTVGVPVDVTADIHRTGYDVTDYQFVFAPTDPAGAFTAAPTVRHTFPRPGVQTFTVYATEVARETGRMTNAAFSFTVDVFAPPTLTAARFQRRHAVFRHGVVGTANAFVGAQTADVTLVVRGRGQVLGRSTTKLGSTPAPFAVALTKSAGRLLARHDSTAALIILRQGGKVLALRKVRID
jgi:hypothetical protein